MHRSIEELSAEARLADLAEAAGPLVHDFSNFLNALLLQVAVLEQLGPPTLHAELAAIREGGRRIGEIIDLWRHYRREARLELQPVDLNRVVQEVVPTLALSLT